MAENIIEGFKNVGKVIRGVFTLDPDLIQEGITGAINAAFNNIDTIVQEAAGLVQDAGKILFENIKTGVEKAKVAAPIDPITGQDIDSFLTRIKDFAVNAGKRFMDFFNTGVEGAAQQTSLAESFKLGDLTQNIQTTMGATLMIIGSSYDSISEQTKRLTEFMKQNLSSLGNAIMNSFNRLLDAKNPIEALKEMLLGLIKRLAAAAFAALLLSAILSSFTGGASLLSSMGGTAGLFKQFMGLGGGAAAAGGGGGFQFQPIDPSLGTRIGTGNITGRNSVNLTGQFRLDGQDLVLAVERANNIRGSFI